MMKRIQVLNSTIVDKIAAGEVIIDSAAVVKELVENSIDAEASRIDIETAEGGKKLIHVSDDGFGILRDDIKTAFLRNATSKITDQIDAINTLGFRGEALASIAFVSKVTLITRTESDDAALLCEIRSGEMDSGREISASRGTSMQIRDLFYNMPARKKHVKDDQMETNKIIDISIRLALSHPEIAFSLTCDNRIIFSTDGSGDILQCIYHTLGKTRAAGLMKFEYADEPLFLEGYITSPNFISERRTRRILILNGRYVENNTVSKAVDDLYGEFYGKKGADYVLYMRLPANMLDVNIHPAKREVRFLNESLIALLIKQGLRDFLSHNFMIKQQPAERPQKQRLETMVFEEPVAYGEQISDDFFEEPVISHQKIDSRQAGTGTEYSVDGGKIFEAQKIKINTSIFSKMLNMKYIGNAFGLYAMFEDTDAIYSIDTHAAHERVLYEKYLKAFRQKQIKTQPLLVPVLVSLSPKQYKTALDESRAFEEIGFETDDFADHTIALRVIPHDLSGSDIADIFETLLSAFEDGKKDAYHARSEELIRIACHNAVRGKRNLSEAEVKALLGDLTVCDIPFTCPHGRPTIGILRMSYFMKAFERI